MQLKGDLENSWMMFNHVKRVQGWTTMAYHVYDPVYCKVMSIAICDMQLEDTEAQCIFWKKQNAIVLKV
jgi:6-phosphofructokinase